MRRLRVERVWTDNGRAARAARAALLPVEAVYRGAVSLRGTLYDRGVLSSHAAPIPVVSVGNLTVGGTGKTPFSAWLARELLDAGACPAVVLRGYGSDETLVHARINPSVPVIVAPDRIHGIDEAVRVGSNAVILDDGFQHRRAARDEDIVLVNADAWTGAQRLIPAGPWREPLTAIGRATLGIVTRKTASPDRVADVLRAVEDAAPHLAVASIRLEPDHLVSVADPSVTTTLERIDGGAVAAIAAVADPDAFFKQLREGGAAVEPHAFPDHHAFTSSEVRDLAAAARRADVAVCTLKDAVKLAPLWPAVAPPLWYVSLSVQVESGRPAIDDLLHRVTARIAHSNW